MKNNRAKESLVLNKTTASGAKVLIKVEKTCCDNVDLRKRFFRPAQPFFQKPFGVKRFFDLPDELGFFKSVAIFIAFQVFCFFLRVDLTGFRPRFFFHRGFFFANSFFLSIFRSPLDLGVFKRLR